MIDDALESGVLDPKVHRRLIHKLSEYAERAGVTPEAICTHLREYAEDQERAWVGEYLSSRKHPPTGLAYIGAWRDAPTRMEGLAGCLVRNFVDARVMSSLQIADQSPTATVLLVPNFFVARSALTGWKVGQLVDTILARTYASKTTVLFIEDMDAMEGAYGRSIYEAVRNKFRRFSR